ncbi:MAG: MBL fold metallo-hydrolase [Myxococcales bacterium]|nr:MBL fold metallo-hydrolase [Myxococcota bacterium]MDW8280966.1 MBL fold metallo-hydrolase [Myxococcales bacterium]
MQEILPGVQRWSWLSPAHGYLFNGYLLHLPDGVVCIDPVQADEADLAAVVAAAPMRIVLTNRNHVRISPLLRERTGAPVAIHPADADHARQQGAVVDEALTPGQRIGPLTVVPVPGKSPGEVALHWPERRLLVVGDALIGDPPGQVRLLRPQVIDDLEGLRRSIRALLALDFDVLLVGDGEPLIGGARAAVQRLVASFPDGTAGPAETAS